MEKTKQKKCADLYLFVFSPNLEGVSGGFPGFPKSSGIPVGSGGRGFEGFPSGLREVPGLTDSRRKKKVDENPASKGNTKVRNGRPQNLQTAGTSGTAEISRLPKLRSLGSVVAFSIIDESMCDFTETNKREHKRPRLNVKIWSIRVSFDFFSHRSLERGVALNFCSLTDCQKLWHNCSLFVNICFDTNKVTS